MNDEENFSQTLTEDQIDIEDEKPFQQHAISNKDASDGSDIEVIAVSRNIAFGKKRNLLRPIYRRRINGFSNFAHGQIRNKQETFIKEEIVISDDSDDCSDVNDNTKNKYKISNSNSSVNSKNKKNKNDNESLSTIILNCPRCNKTEKVFSITITSTCKECNVNMSYVCNTCNKRYNTMSALYRHKKLQCHLVTSQNKKKISPLSMFIIKCNKCNWVKRQVKTKLPEPCNICNMNPIFECIICSKTYTSYSGIYCHVRLFCQPRKRTYYCNDCNYSCIQQEKILYHQRRYHMAKEPENVTCAKCNKTFELKEQLKKHEVQCGIPYYKCNYCSYKPKFCDNLKKHLLTNHEDRVQAEGLDNILARVIEDKSNLKDKKLEYIRKDSNNELDLIKIRKQHCPNCNISLDYNHFRDTCERCGVTCKNECGACGKTFGSLSALSRHIRRYHNQSAYRCEICQRGFACFGDANQHRKHCGLEKSYTCKFCTFTTAYKQSLRTHIYKLHNTNRSSFVCQNCGMSYKTNRAIKRHAIFGCIKPKQ